MQESASFVKAWLVVLILVKSVLVLATTPKITRVGRYLYDADGNRFYIKGLAFQKPGKVSLTTPENQRQSGFPETTDFIDPLGDSKACKSVLQHFKELNINTIRIYAYDSKLDHSACMDALERAGIYVIADISLPLAGSINQVAPSWDVSLMTRYIKQIDSLRAFRNLLAFNIGNEIITNESNMGAAPYIKAAARDVKRYLRAVKSSALVSYTSTDGTKFPADLARSLSCDSHEGLDLYGLINYRWCGNSNFQSAYEELNDQFRSLPIPVFFSEFGCIKGSLRQWTEVQALYSTLMSDIWSGGIAFSYFPMPQGYGLVKITDGNKAEVTKEFALLAAQFARVSAPNAPKVTSLSLTAEKCAGTNSNSFAVLNVIPPEPNMAACRCADERAFSCLIRNDASAKVVAEHLEESCRQLANSDRLGAATSCKAIAGNTKQGTYGILSACSAKTRLNYVFSQVFLERKATIDACDFSGNATVNLEGKPKTMIGIDDEVSKCFATFANSTLAHRTEYTRAGEGRLISQGTEPPRIDSGSLKAGGRGLKNSSGSRRPSSGEVHRRGRRLG